MATEPHSMGAPPAAPTSRSVGRRLSTETKQAFKTTEFYVYAFMVIAVLIAGAVTKAGGGHDDRLAAAPTWLYVTLLTLGYLLSRGLAKSGSRDPYWDQPSAGDDGSITDRVRTAAQVLKDGEDAVGTGRPRSTDGA